MHLVCLDLEGVLVPEIWLAVAQRTGIDALRLTTRDISDYDALMRRRISILAEHGIGLSKIQTVIETLEPLEGAADFLRRLREVTPVVILSDTFREFAVPILRRLEWPTLFCNELVVDEGGMIRNYVLRRPDGKRNAVQAFKSMGLNVIAAGDSYNDLGMLQEADFGILFRAPEKIRNEQAQFPVYDAYDAFLAHVNELTGR